MTFTLYHNENTLYDVFTTGFNLINFIMFKKHTVTFNLITVTFSKKKDGIVESG